jgi:hypothetical protein
MELNKYISDLLRKHNCVIVPDFGGFVANYRSAVIDKVRGKIYPPSKSVLFNSHLTDNDGLLGNYVARQEQTDYPTALKQIEEGVINWRKELSSGSRIEVGEIGFLYEEKGKIHFEQSREVNLLMQAYGLRSIDFVDFKKVEKPLPVEVKTEVKKESTISHKKADTPIEAKVEAHQPTYSEKTQKESTVIVLDKNESINEVAEKAVQEDVIPIRKPKRYKAVLKYTAAVLFVPVLFYSYWIPMETDFLETKMIHISDFNPVHKQAEKIYSSRNEVFEDFATVQHKTLEELTENINAQVYNYELSEDFYVPIKLENQTVEDVNVADQADAIPSGNYHVIAGCFSVQSNAENLVKELNAQGYSAAILDKSKGLHRVTAGGYGSRDAANSALDQLKGSGKSGWILKK